ncbi:MAG: bis(5'-nucleosyl)-tetraphosphatase (symmetrical) YqeK [Cyanobacteria bacterium REEB67]|nr:bis(5'-nucleosyl)-tetraphosphatase (symmetrical) YqeK [Cyanobacteria bacterium REEB67]
MSAKNIEQGEKTIAVSGVPASLTLDFAREWALARVSKKRADHVVGVQKVGKKLARLAGLDRQDQFIVELACLLHDACKEFKDAKLVELAAAGGLQPNQVEQVNGHLLHGPVAALVVRDELAVSNEAVLAAITEHTLGNRPMSDISKIVFLADCLEESRPKDYTRPIWQALETPAATGDGPASQRANANQSDRDDKKKKANEVEATSAPVNLDNAMLVALDLGLAQLLDSRRAIHPKTVDVRNYFLGIVRASAKTI